MDKNLNNLGKLPLDLPAAVRAKQLELLELLGVRLDDPRSIAKAIMAMSDFYAKHPEKSSPWAESWAKIAYVAYYMPLNFWRLCGVVIRGQQVNFFEGFERYIDFGSGLGSVGMAFEQAGLLFQSGHCVESSGEAIDFHKRLVSHSQTPLSWASKVTANDVKGETLAIFSYSFTELKELPSWVDQCRGVLIVEPSTRDDARRLQKLRSILLEKGWHVWGPCTHAEACPLLEESNRDWCHDRIVWQQPQWLKDIESQMPIKNGTLPCSWLMMRRDPPPRFQRGVGRITGDLQEFKGFAKQLVCRGSSREFLAWQKKDFKKGYPEIARGELVIIKDDLPIKGNEIRATLMEDVVKY